VPVKLYRVNDLLRGIYHAVFILIGQAMNSSGQQNDTSTISAEQAWVSLLEELSSTPLDIPASWPENTNSQWSSDGLCLIVSVPDTTDKDWIDRKFLPLARIYFQEFNSQKHLVVKQKVRGKNNDFLVQIQKNAYEEVVCPRKMVPVPYYLFHHWLPVLGPSLFWVVLAIRQQSFVNTSREDSVCKLISTRELAYWAPLSYSQISRLLNRDGFSSWFYKKEKEGYQDVPPEYKVWSQVPLSPHHLFWLDNYFSKREKGLTASSMIESLLDNTGKIRGIKKEDVSIPLDFSKKRLSLSDILADHFPREIDEELAALAIQLEYQITRENMFLAIPHYFFAKYGDDLSSNEAAFIWYLRSVYKEKGNDSLSFTGYSRIKNALGCSLNTVKNLASKALSTDEGPNSSPWNTFYDPELSLRNWLSADILSPSQKGIAGEIEIKVRVIEPVHLEDTDQYHSFVQKQLESVNDNKKEGGRDNLNDAVNYATPETRTFPEGVKYATRENNEISPPVKNATAPVKDTTQPVNKETTDIKNSTQNLSDTQHLKYSYNHSLNTLLNASQPPLLGVENSNDLVPSTPMVGVVEINLDKLLGFSSYKQKEKKLLKEKFEKDQELFLAWIIRNFITGAKLPVRLAVKNLQEGNETETQYLEIARLGWGTIVKMVRVNLSVMDMWKEGIIDDEDNEYMVEIFRKISKQAMAVIKDLKNTNFIQLVENVLMELNE